MMATPRQRFAPNNPVHMAILTKISKALPMVLTPTKELLNNAGVESKDSTTEYSIGMDALHYLEESGTLVRKRENMGYSWVRKECTTETSDEPKKRNVVKTPRRRKFSVTITLTENEFVTIHNIAGEGMPEFIHDIIISNWSEIEALDIPKALRTMIEGGIPRDVAEKVYNNMKSKGEVV